MTDNQLKARPVQAAVYVRVSTDDQADSLDSQTYRCEGWLRGQGFSEADVGQVEHYVDHGFSGKDTRRPAFQRLMRDVRRGRIKLVVFTELSRVSRSLSDFLQMQETWAEHTVHWASLRERFDTSSEYGELLIRIMVSLNEFERKQVARRTRANMLARAERGLWNGGTFPLGYRASEQLPGGLEIVEAEARLVRDAFSTYLELGGPNPTANELTRRGYRNRRGNPISWTVVNHLLQNPVYIGVRAINGGSRHLSMEEMQKLPEADRYREVPGRWAPIIDMETWERAKALREANKRARNATRSQRFHDYVLTGIVRCGTCGVMLEGGGGKGCLYFYYRHPTGTRTPECKHVSYRAELVEGSVLGRLRKYLDNDKLLDRIISKTNADLADGVPQKEDEVREARRKAGALETQRENLVSNLAQAPAGSVPAAFWDRVTDLEAQIAEVGQHTRTLER